MRITNRDSRRYDFFSGAVTTVHNDDNLESETVTDLNADSLPTEVDEYGYGQNAPGALARETLTCYASLSNPHILDRPSAVVIYSTSGNPADCSGTANEAARTGFLYDGNGNLTTLTEYVTPSSSISRSFSYGSYGVLTGATDFSGTWTYFTNPTCSGAFPTSINQPMSLNSSLAWNCNTGLVTSVTDPNNQTTSFSYDEMYRPLQTNYPDGGQVAMTYNDVSGGTWSAVKTTKLNSSQNRTDTTVLDGLGRVTQTQLNSDPAGPDYVDTTYDSLGRVAGVTNPYRTNWATGGDTYTYDALGRVTNIEHADNNSRSVSYGSGSPHCSAGPSGMGYSELITDEAGHQRLLFADAFGQVIESDEPDPYNGNAFDYWVCSSYDALGNLTNAAQWIQPRSYTYDMLSRVTSADNAESGTTYYSYTNSGGGLCSGDPSEPCTRTDANHVTTTYTYDALNHLTSKSYTDGTPTRSYYYGMGSVWGQSVSNPLGRLTLAQVTSGSTVLAATAIGGYDAMGRITFYRQCTPSNCGTSAWGMSYGYDLAGDITSWTHPAGFTITNQINGAQQVTQIQNSPVDSTHPQYLAQNITYTPWGAEQTLTNGCAGSGCINTLESYTYNNRLQPVEIELGTSSNASADYCLVYNYYTGVGNPSSCSAPSQGTTGDNGDVLAFLFQDNANSSYFSRTESYTYDALDRLTSGVAVGNNNGYNYNLTYVYDSFGNMTCQVEAQTDGYCPNWTYNSATNQFTMSGFAYDADGNLTSDGSHTYQYDAEGRMISVDNGSTAEFSYNALGWRVFWGPGSGISYWHDASGQAIGGYTTGGSNAFIFWGGRELAEYEADGVYLAHANSLNSVVQDTNWAGATAYDLLINPWGQTWTDAGPMAGRLHEVFGGIQDYDPSLGQCQATFRKYNPGLARWLSPDPLGGNVADPQSLNRYAYVLNNPTTLVDPSGLGNCNPRQDPQCTGGNDSDGYYCSFFESNDASCQNPPDKWPDGTPIGDGLGGGVVFGGGGGGGGSVTGTGSSGATAASPIGPSISESICGLGGCGGLGDGFLNIDAIPLPWVLRVTSWDWPWILAGAAEAGEVASRVVPWVGIGASVLMMKSDANPAQIASKAARNDNRTFSKNPICDHQYKADIQRCKRAAMNQRPACYAQAMERLVACEQGKPLPPLPF